MPVDCYLGPLVRMIEGGGSLWVLNAALEIELKVDLKSVFSIK